MTMAANEYLNFLFQQKEEHEFFYLWQGQTKRSVWFKEIDEAVNFLGGANKDVYAGMAIAPDPRTLKREKQKSIQHIRCANDEALGMSCLYMDIDVKHDVHEKENLPPTIEDALELVVGHGYDPSLVIDSGYGLHCYWLFKELWRFDSQMERQSAYLLNHRLCGTVRARAQERGWTVDSVFDLSRVLRVPGTLNCKNGTPREVRFLKPSSLEDDIPFYNPEDFDEFLLDTMEIPEHSTAASTKTAPVEATTIHTKVGELVFDPQADPPLDKMMDIATIFDPEFKKTWDAKRGKDLKDQSPSGYNFALAIMCVKHGWTDQEIVNIMIAWRRRHKKQLKLNNHQYYARTVIEARERIRIEEADEKLTEFSVLSGTEYEPENLREESLKMLSQKWGINILKIISFKGDDNSYLIKTGDFGDIFLPNVSYITSGTKFRDKFANATKRYIKWKKGKWDFYAQLMLNCCEDQWVSEEAESDTRIACWLASFLSENPVYDTPEGAHANRYPFELRGDQFIFFDSFFQWAKVKKGYQGTIHELQVSAARVGIRRHTVNFNFDGQRTTASCWNISPVINNPELVKQCEIKDPTSKS